MTQEVEATLASIDPANEGTVDDVIEGMLKELRAVPQRIVELWQVSQGDLSARSAQLLAHLQESAISLISDAAEAPAQRQQLTPWFVESYSNLHNAAWQRLEMAFADRRLIPANADSRAVEREDPPRRVCDEAYLQLRLLTHLTESAVTAQISRDEFLSQSDEEKDREIQQLQTLGKWTAFVEEVEDDEESK